MLKFSFKAEGKIDLSLILSIIGLVVSLFT
jgi:hypothetical protein